MTSFFFSFFTHTTKATKQVEKTKKALLQRQYFQVKINQILSSLKESSFCVKKGEKNPVLFFYFQGQIDPDPNFSGELHGKILLEKENLYLYLLSKDQKKQRKEALLHNVKNWQILFLEKQESLFLWDDPTKTLNFSFPLAIKIICSPKKGDPVTFVFFPKQKNPQISYKS